MRKQISLLHSIGGGRLLIGLMLLGFSVVLPWPTAAQDRCVVRIAPQSIVENSTIEIGNIAQVSGPAETAGRIRRISLGHAPDIGTTRIIRRQQVLMALNAAGFSLDSILVESAETTAVRRPGQSVPGSILRSVIENALLKSFQDTNIEVRLARLQVPEAIQVPTGKVDFRVDSSTVRNLFAQFSLPIEIRVNGILVRSFAATVEIEAFGHVLTASSDLSKGDDPSISRLHFDRTRLTSPASSYVFNMESLKGKTLVRDIRSGSPITTDLLVSVAVIKVGDSVRVETGTGNFRIAVTGEAKGSGRIGDRIAVKNSQNGTLLQATVIDKGLVRISL